MSEYAPVAVGDTLHSAEVSWGTTRIDCAELTVVSVSAKTIVVATDDRWGRSGRYKRVLHDSATQEVTEGKLYSVPLYATRDAALDALALNLAEKVGIARVALEEAVAVHATAAALVSEAKGEALS